MGNAADGDKRKEKSIRQIQGAECRYQNAVERREIAGDLRQLLGGPACLSIQANRLNVTVTDEWANEQQKQPECATSQKIAKFLSEEGPKPGWVDPVALK
jgi:hypothetical protein